MRLAAPLAALPLVVGCSGATPTAEEPAASASASAAPPLAAASALPPSSAAPPVDSGNELGLQDTLALSLGRLPPTIRKKMEDLCASDENTLDAGMACENLAALLGQGAMGVETNKELADKLFERGRGKDVFACRGGETAACSHIGLMNAMKLRTLDPNSEKAKVWAKASGPWLSLACEGGDPVACDALADILEVGRGVPADPVAAKQVRIREAELRARAPKN